MVKKRLPAQTQQAAPFDKQGGKPAPLRSNRHLLCRNLGNHELAGSDERFVLFYFRYDISREVGVLLGDADAFVRNFEDEGLTSGELAIHGHLANVVGCNIYPFHHGGKDC